MKFEFGYCRGCKRLHTDDSYCSKCRAGQSSAHHESEKFTECKDCGEYMPACPTCAQTVSLTTSHAQGEEKSYDDPHGIYENIDRAGLIRLRKSDTAYIFQQASQITELTQALKAAEVDVRMANAMFVQERRDFDKLKAENERLRAILERIISRFGDDSEAKDSDTAWTLMVSVKELRQAREALKVTKAKT